MAPPIKKNNSASKYICYCNSVTRAEVEEAIRGGCATLGKIFDRTRAGVGACGGTCQTDLRKLIESYAAGGEFPPVSVKEKKSRR